MGVSSSIAMYYLGKHLIKSQKDKLTKEIYAYLGSPEGQQSIRNLGTIFAQGLGKGIGLGDSALKGKTFGVSNQILFPIVQRFLGKKTDKPINEEKHTTGSGKFG